MNNLNCILINSSSPCDNVDDVTLILCYCSLYCYGNDLQSSRLACNPDLNFFSFWTSYLSSRGILLFIMLKCQIHCTCNVTDILKSLMDNKILILWFAHKTSKSLFLCVFLQQSPSTNLQKHSTRCPERKLYDSLKAIKKFKLHFNGKFSCAIHILNKNLVC